MGIRGLNDSQIKIIVVSTRVVMVCKVVKIKVTIRPGAVIIKVAKSLIAHTVSRGAVMMSISTKAGSVDQLITQAAAAIRKKATASRVSFQR